MAAGEVDAAAKASPLWPTYAQEIDPESGEFSAWYLHGGSLKGCLAVGRSEDLVHARTLIETGAVVASEKDALADVDSDRESIGE